MSEPTAEICQYKYLLLPHDITCIVLLIVGLLPIIYGFMGFYQNRNKINNKFISSYIIVSVSYVVLCVSSIITARACHNNSDAFQRILRMCQGTSYAVVIILALMVIIFRLCVTFNGTPYQIPKRTRIFFSISSVVILIASVASLNAATWYSNKNEILFKVNASIGSIFYVCYSMLFGLVMRKYLKTLVAYTVSIRDVKTVIKHSDQTKTIAMAKKDEFQTNKSQKQIISIATKYFILGIVLFISTILGLISNALVSHYKTYLSVNIQVLVWLLDGLLNVICLYMQYHFAENHFQIFCGKLYKYVYKRLDTVIVKRNSSLKLTNLSPARIVAVP